MLARSSFLSSVLTLGLAVGAAQAVNVEFRQLHWLADDGTVKHPFSRVGEVELHFDPTVDLMFVGQFAFVNIVTGLAQPGAKPQWSVQNWPLIYPNLEHLLSSSPSVQFDLGNQPGQPVNQIFFNVIITPEPLPEVPIELVQLSLVSAQPYHVGGFGWIDGVTGGSGLSTIPFTIGPYIGILPFIPDFPVSAAWTSVGGDDLPEVDEELNGCAPGSVARSIGYMLTGLGEDPGDPQDAYDELKDDMDTVTGEDGGTSVENFGEGKDAYVERHMLPINSELQFGFAALLATVKDALSQGGDVEIMIAWDDDPDDPDDGGGHAAMITSVINLASGGAIITYVDDPTQGDGRAENEEHTITVGRDGTFDGGTVFGFLVETTKNPGDLNADGVVNGFDLALLLGAWSIPAGAPGCGGLVPCGADINGDGVVDGIDLALLLGGWG